MHTEIIHRPLSAQEHFFHRSDVFVQYIMSGAGVLEKSALSLTLHALYVEFPILRAILIEDSAQCTGGDTEITAPSLQIADISKTQPSPLLSYDYVFDAAQADFPAVILENKCMMAVSVYQTQAENFSANSHNNPGDLSDYQDNLRFTIVFHIRHIISDAKNAVVILERFWELYTEQSTMNAIQLRVPVELPRSYEDILSERNIRDFPPFDTRIFKEIPQLCPVPKIVEGTFPIQPSERLLLSREFSETLKIKSRKCGITINSLLSAATIIAEFDFLEQEGKANSSFLYTVAVNLRPRLDPPVTDSEVTNFLGNVLFIAQKNVLTEKGTPERIHNAILKYSACLKNQLESDIHSKAVYTAGDVFRDPEQGGDTTLDFNDTLGLTHSNWGVIPDFITPPGIDLDDFHGWSVIAPAADALNPRKLYGAFVHKSIIFSSTFQGKIGMDFLQQPPLYPPYAAKFMVERAREILQEWVDET